MPRILVCTTCGSRLSGDLQVRSVKDPATPTPNHEMGKPLTPSGVALKSWKPIVWSDDPDHRPPLQFIPQHWLNPKDVEAALKDISDVSRLNGCCGRDGHGGPNQICRKFGVEVGTVMDDCWTDLIFIPEPSATHWIETDNT